MDLVTTIRTTTSTTETKVGVKKDEAALNGEPSAALESLAVLEQGYKEPIATLLRKPRKASGTLKINKQNEGKDTLTQGKAIIEAGGEIGGAEQTTNSTDQTNSEGIIGDNIQTKSEDNNKTATSELVALLESHVKFTVALLEDICGANHTTPPAPGTPDGVKEELAKGLKDWRDINDLYEELKQAPSGADPDFIAYGTSLPEGMSKIFSKLAADLKAQQDLVSARDSRMIEFE
ncbi:hypothetical protein LTR84_002498 [Exophiala bonariae]|uniref:Uncharacterized protein n=1 Tax=Exophiala bonariae TaxID=1690606 RepID=A0AAV9N9N0_9EURO|nr:hypothetical protein LTR84_002498 [Exophiala bonariae]